MEASGRPCVALLAPLRPVFVSGLSDYSCIPEDVVSTSPRPEAQRKQEVVCEEDVITGSEISLGRILTSQLFIHFVICPLS